MKIKNVGSFVVYDRFVRYIKGGMPLTILIFAKLMLSNQVVKLSEDGHFFF